VLPGVAVEAASPALIEKVRSVVTDGTGQFRIVDLRPGVYEVTFTLPGFAVVRRQGIELTGTFTATVNAEMRVGALEETVTVTGESPVVDVQSTQRQQVMNQEVLDALPAGRTPATMIAVLPGVTREREDVGGIIGDGSRRGGARARGNDDVRTVVGGVSLQSPSGSGGSGGTAMNLAAYQEVAVDTGGLGAEGVEAGVRVNLIPRDGGNTFSGRLFANFANSAMQGDNFTQDLRDRGLGTPNTVNKLWEFNPSLGGPIMRDRLWFHWTMRHAGSFEGVPIFFNKHAGNPNVWIYEPDTTRPVSNKNTIRNFTNVHVTWQATAKNKFAVTYDPSDICDCPSLLTARTSPEGTGNNYVRNKPLRFLIGSWTAPLTNRILLESTFVTNRTHFTRPHENPYLPPGTVGMIAAQEQSTGITYRATATNHDTTGDRNSWRGTFSYITGAHAFKAGLTYVWATLGRFEYSQDAPMAFRFRDGVPNRITLHARDTLALTNLDADHGLFIQDRWTVNRLTLTGGLRYDYVRIFYPETRVGPTQFAPTRNIVLPSMDGVQWHDIAPRLGVAYNLFGDGKTALKASLGKYLRGTYIGSGALADVTGGIAPALRLITSTTRSWTDANGNYVPECNLLNPLANGECGAMANPNFGSTAGGRVVDPDILHGWGKRPYNWQFSVGAQRELLPRVSVDVSYWRSWWGDFYVTDNRAVGPTDYDEFSITAPRDPRLPGGGGSVISGLYDIKPEKFGVPADDFFTFAHKHGKQTEVWNGVDVTVDARPRAGVLLQGGVSLERQTTDDCEVRANLDNPSPLYCHVEGTFLTQVKLVSSYTIPRVDVQVSGSLQSLPGPEITADYIAATAEVRPSLGRNLAGGERNVTVTLVEPRSMYGERLNQLDLRVGKILNFGRTRATATLDLYNSLNTSAARALSNRFETWQRPEQILPARFVKVGLQLAF
jgi:hypothetical protein